MQSWNDGFMDHLVAVLRRCIPYYLVELLPGVAVPWMKIPSILQVPAVDANATLSILQANASFGYGRYMAHIFFKSFQLDVRKMDSKVSSH